MFRLRIILLSLISCVFIACQNDDLSIGKGWIDPSTRVIFIDTCSVNLSTMWRDSIVTSNKNTAFVGQYNDKYTGKITASSYVEVSLPSSKDIDDKAVFDSLCVHLYPAGKYFGDTTLSQTINIHRLNKILLLDDKNSLYNSSVSDYDPTPLSSKSIRIEPSRTRNGFDFKLSTAFGKELFEKFRRKGLEVENNNEFVNYLKGFAFTSSNEAAVFAYKVQDTISVMTLYYHLIEGGRQQDKTMTFNLNTSKQYNQIIADRSQTDLKDMNVRNRLIPSGKTNNQAYIESGVPLVAKLEFPSVHNLAQVGKYGRIESAILRIRPVRAGYVNNTPLPATLNLALLNEANEIGAALTDYNNNTQTGNLVKYNYENTYYTFNITSYLNNYQLRPTTEKYNLALIIPASEWATSIQRLIIGDKHSEHIGDRIELEIRYSTYIGEN